MFLIQSFKRYDQPTIWTHINNYTSSISGAFFYILGWEQGSVMYLLLGNKVDLGTVQLGLEVVGVSTK